jgi:hypothetical protein
MSRKLLLLLVPVIATVAAGVYVYLPFGGYSGSGSSGTGSSQPTEEELAVAAEFVAE